MAPTNKNIKEKTLELVSKYFESKAEFLQDSLHELYYEPFYFTKLNSSSPFILEGGRGTGKTTTLRALSYQGQWNCITKKADILQ